MALATIDINFINATLTSTTSQILIGAGSFALDTVSALSVSGTVSFNSLYLTSGALTFEAPAGTSFDCSIILPLEAGAGAPTLEITNFAGTATVTWPTASGLQTQTVTPGDPITLNGFTG